MKSEWRNIQLGKIQNGTSIFGLIPKEIGNIIYCDTTSPVNDGASNNNKAKYGLLFAFIIVVLLWVFLYKIYAIPVIATILLACVAPYILSMDNGTDFLLGEKGFAVIKYRKRRDNIIDTNIIMFDEVSQFFSGETKIIKKSTFSEEYDRTDYFFSIYKKSNTSDDVIYTLLYSKEGSYKVGDEKDPEDLWIFPEYTFFKEVEKVWYRIYLEKTQNAPKAFHVLKSALHKNRIKDKAVQQFIGSNGITAKSLKTSNLADIRIEGNKLIIDTTEYDLSCLKYIYIEKGNLIVEHENHKRKAMGLVEKGDIHAIQLWGLGNAMAFLYMLKTEVQQD